MSDNASGMPPDIFRAGHHAAIYTYNAIGLQLQYLHASDTFYCNPMTLCAKCENQLLLTGDTA